MIDVAVAVKLARASTGAILYFYVLTHLINQSRVNFARSIRIRPFCLLKFLAARYIVLCALWRSSYPFFTRYLRIVS